MQIMNNIENIVEGLLFVSGEAVEKSIIIEKLQINEKELKTALEKLAKKYGDESGIKLMQFKNKIQFSSNSKYAEEIATVLNPIRERMLSKSTLETVAIIAYKQPITRLEIENIRGVNSDYALQTLLKFNLIEVVGRKDALGKPLLFGTTDQFLKRFNLSDINDLPDYDQLLEQIKIFNEQYGAREELLDYFEIPDDQSKKENQEIIENSIAV